jgi:hypothetical protein
LFSHFVATILVLGWLYGSVYFYLVKKTIRR